MKIKEFFMFYKNNIITVAYKKNVYKKIDQKMVWEGGQIFDKYGILRANDLPCR
jgi:hypothetical protein